MKSPSDEDLRTLIINVESRKDRQLEMEKRFKKLNLSFEFIKAIEPSDLVATSQKLLSQTAECVWLSHIKCLHISSKRNHPTLIVEDDATFLLKSHELTALANQMSENGIDFIQIGYLNLNLAEGIAIRIRNLYNFFTKKNLAPRFLKLFGFKEVERSASQGWRRNLPNNFVVNDVRYGAHCYLVSPNFAKSMLELNSPAFLAADDFYVALSRMKTFRMVRLAKSLSGQDGSPSSFSQRYLAE